MMRENPKLFSSKDAAETWLRKTGHRGFAHPSNRTGVFGFIVVTPRYDGMWAFVNDMTLVHLSEW